MPSTLHGSQGRLSTFAIGYLFTMLGSTVFFAWIHHRTGGSILAAVAAPFDGSIIAVATVLLAIGATALAWRDPSLAAPRTPQVAGRPRRDARPLTHRTGVLTMRRAEPRRAA